ncbi:hypothetical protein LH464_21345 [Neorhizobium sp. T786]|uniref:hypothetical protein n=1 Tax=Pseudorhizobium xiangyangii TaxID=2883104 RepID=UPI001CFFAE4B|nr:hypothetical protein [Neorhizobium xiangyangii]MCB5205015.1 hypothetical protein [Neorhizobium xiangyangii]
MADVNSELDDLLSDDTGSTGPADITVTQPAEVLPVVEATTTQPRDETGKFAPRQETAAVPEPVIDPAQPAHHDKPNNGVPVRAVQEERQKRQEAESTNEALRRELAEMRGQLQTLTQQRQQPAQQQQEEKPATLWDDPDSYLRNQITPVQSQIMEMKEFMSENMAIQTYGAEKVEAAKQALEQAARTPEGQQVIQKVLQSRHPFEEVVKWHQQSEAIRRVGNDPDAWFQAEYERRLADPAEQAKILERIRGTATSNTNRSAPAVSLPPSLSGLPAGGNTAADNDVSDAALFSQALR